jgi:hypothetical protein
MRKDIAKLTTERPRAGRGGAVTKKYGGRVHIIHDPDHLYEKEHGGFHSSARRRHPTHKHLTDALNPLTRALDKNVGRPWDDVYSEFCQSLDRRSVAGLHIWGHLMDLCAVKSYYDTDGSTKVLGRWYGEHYVDPDGILRKRQPRKRYKGERYPVVGDEIEITNGALKPRFRIPSYLTHLYTNPRHYEYYRLEECGRSPKNRFLAWFHYSVETVDESYWLPISEEAVKRNYHLSRTFMIGEDGTYFVWQERTKALSTKRSCNRKQLQAIRKYLNRV